MAWDLEWGTPDRQKFLKTLEEQGAEPGAMKNRPRLKPWVTEYFRAFQILSFSRPIGMSGVGSIPVSEMVAYFALCEIHDPDEREAYVTMIQALDSAYLLHVNKTPEKKAADARLQPRRR